MIVSSPQSSSYTVLASKASDHLSLSLSLSPASVKAISIHLENYTSTGGNFLVLVMIMLVLCSQYTVVVGVGDIVSTKLKFSV